MTFGNKETVKYILELLESANLYIFVNLQVPQHVCIAIRAQKIVLLLDSYWLLLFCINVHV